MARSNKHKTEIKSYSAISFYIFFVFIIIAIPLIYSKETLDPVLMPQLFAAAIFLMIYSFYQIIFQKERFLSNEVLKNPVVWLLSAFTLLTAISASYAFNYKESFFFIAKSIVFLFVTIITYKTLKQRKNHLLILSYLFLIATFISLIIGFYQYFEEVFPDPSKKLIDGRHIIYKVIGLMAHKNLFASSLFMSLPFMVFGLFRAKQLMKWVFGFAIILTGLMIILLSTRAVWLGMIAAFAVIFILLLFKGGIFHISKPFKKVLIVATIIFGIVSLGIVFGIGTQNEVSYIEHFKSIFEPKNINNIYRLNVWQLTLDMVAENPVAGVGAGNWNILAGYHFHKFNFSLNQMAWVRPHNDFLWVLAETGIIGFLLFIGSFILIFKYLLRILFKSQERDHKLLALVFIGGLSGYLVISFFDFPFERIVHQVWLALIFGIILFLNSSMRESKNVQPLQGYWSLIIPFLLIFPIVYARSVSTQESLVIKARNAQFNNDWKGMLELAKKIPVRFKNIDAEAIPIYYYHGLAYERLNMTEKAKVAYETAIKHHPTYVGVLNNLGLMLFNLKDYEGARSYFNKSLEILPDFNEPIINLSATYSIQEDYETALQILDRIPAAARDQSYIKRIEWLNDQIKLRK